MAWYNPATWTPVDKLQNSLESFSGSGGTSAVFTNPYGIAPSSSDSGSVLGTNTDSAYKGSTYYDSATGQMMEWTGSGYQPASAGGANETPTYSSYTSGSGSGSTTPSYSQADMDYLNSQQSLYERLMQSIGATEQEGLADLGRTETSARNSANTQRGRALEDFGMQRDDSERGQTSALNRVGDNSRTLRNSLMRQLGLGASGGSAFQVADQAVARDASKNRAGVQESYGVNFRNLGTAEKRAEEDYKSLLDEIANDRRTKEEKFRGGIIGQRQSTQQALDEIAAERARLLGGSGLNNNLAYNNFNMYQGQLDALPSQFNRNVEARQLKVETPKLRDYIVDRASIGGGQSKQSQYSPYSQFLQRDDEEERMM